jgi:hypothetical protein
VKASTYVRYNTTIEAGDQSRFRDVFIAPPGAKAIKLVLKEYYSGRSVTVQLVLP